MLVWAPMSLSAFIAESLPAEESQKLQAWLADPAQGFDLSAPPDAAFFSLKDEELQAAARLNLHSRRILQAKAKGGH